jgi:hypothetical protein
VGINERWRIRTRVACTDVDLYALRLALFQPFIKFRDKCIHRGPTRTGYPAHRESTLLLPALYGADVSADIPTDLLPAIENVFPDLTHGDLVQSNGED